MSQLALAVLDDTVLWVVLGWDGTPVDVMKVGPKKDYPITDEVESWHSAATWGWLAARQYDSLMWLGHS